MDSDTGPRLFSVAGKTAVVTGGSRGIGAMIAAGLVKAQIGARFRLDDIAGAHRAAESRATQGATLIIP